VAAVESGIELALEAIAVRFPQAPWQVLSALAFAVDDVNRRLAPIQRWWAKT
jgi:hypothetical protein